MQNKGAQRKRQTVEHYVRTLKGKPELERVRLTRKSAIARQCLECVGGVKSEVRLCTDVNCPLFPFRPYKSCNQCDKAN